MAIDKNSHLKEVLDTHKMHHVQDFVDKVKNRREEIKAKMHDDLKKALPSTDEIEAGLNKM